jgi:predicted Fe-Mo cluster-binding NifX family protein
LATHRLATSGQSLDYLLRNCCRYPANADGSAFDPLDLLIGDKMFLLYYLRGITFGNVYEFVLNCPKCEKVSTHIYDLNELAKTVVWADDTIGQEPFKVSLPYLSKVTGRDIWVEVRFLRSRDMSQMLSMMRQKKKVFNQSTVRAGNQQPKRQSPFARRAAQQEMDVMLDETVSENIEQVIVSLLGEKDRMAIKSLVQKLHSTDTSTIREWLKQYQPGIESTIEVDCKECGETFKSELPITESFFRPQKS